MWGLLAASWVLVACGFAIGWSVRARLDYTRDDAESRSRDYWDRKEGS